VNGKLAVAGLVGIQTEEGWGVSPKAAVMLRVLQQWDGAGGAPAASEFG